ncbi:hypothetical protein DOU18_15775 [Clavibacter michiganensis subsp. michiganensis]|nr:hypothetical protein [Clavibacter michiganensis subsp. michiganensis]
MPLAPSDEPAMRAVGMAGTEGLGGRLTITTRALVFRTHAANRVRGTSARSLRRATCPGASAGGPR